MKVCFVASDPRDVMLPETLATSARHRPHGLAAVPLFAAQQPDAWNGVEPRGALAPGLSSDQPSRPLDPVVLRKVAWVGGSVALSALVLQRVKALGLLSHSASTAANALWVSVGGLLSSSCCLVQLALNAFSLGCAGFASLDKFRPFFLSTTFGTLLLRAHLEHRAGIMEPRLLSWTAALALSFLPELLRWRNQQALRQGSSSSRPSTAAAAAETINGAPVAMPSTPLTTQNRVTLEAIVVGVKCEGCAAGLRQALREIPEPATSGTDSADIHSGTGSSQSNKSGTKGGPEVRVVSSAVAWYSPEASTVRVSVEGDAPPEVLGAAAHDALDRACAARSYSYSLKAPHDAG
jgi:hypothetical protein